MNLRETDFLIPHRSANTDPYLGLPASIDQPIWKIGLGISAPDPFLSWPISINHFGWRKGLSISEPEHAKAEVRELGRLGANWDGYGASPLSEKVINNAIRFLGLLENENINLTSPDLSPLANGTIALEWQSVHGFAYMEIGKSSFSLIISRTFGSKMLFDGDAGTIGFDHAFMIAAMLFPPTTPAMPVSVITFGI